jgi:hypothetical protein
VADWAVEAFHDLQKNYFANPKYQGRLTLQAGQVIVIDNYRMLHGRDAFSNGQTGRERRLRRIWLAHDRLPVLRNAAGEHRERRAIKRFQAYDILSAPGYDEAAVSAHGIRMAA